MTDCPRCRVTLERDGTCYPCSHSQGSVLLDHDAPDRTRLSGQALPTVLAAAGGDAEVREVAERERDSWTPVDLLPYLDGTFERPEPSVGLPRCDGLRLLYPGKEHSVIGEMESGKSWFSLACAAAELTDGHTVVYIHFEEADPADSVERLQALGVSGRYIRQGFRFVGPNEPITKERLNRLLDPPPTLVVLDGQNEGMALHAQAIREEDGAAAFRRRLVKPWTEVGAAVLTCDHVVKDKEARGRYALGSIHKGNGINGSLILLENDEPFGRGERGSSRVNVVKDRPGYLRRRGRATKTPGKTYLGQLVVDDSLAGSKRLELIFFAPNDDKPTEEKTDLGPVGRPDVPIKQWVLDAIASRPEQRIDSTRALFALLRARKIEVRDAMVRDALEELIIEGRLVGVFARRGRGYRIIPGGAVEPESTTPTDAPDIDDV